ncbi:MAG TPA: UrcA family protein [Vitreimonas sp.]|nr:UrcA family protein [Vitreimonas sp.]
MHRLTGALVSALVLATPNFAAALEDYQKVVVQVGDLDTTAEQDADRALHRMRRAAQDVCDAPPAMRSYDDRRAAQACVEDAMSRAVDDFGDPAVAARFYGGRLYARSGERS